MIRNAVLGLVSAVALVSSANAADVYVPAAPGGYKDGPVFVPNIWAGFYGGLNAGGEWSNTSISDVYANGALFERGNINSSGFVGGGQIGYNWQFGNLVFGPEIDLGGVSNSRTTSFDGGITHYGSSGNFTGDFTGRIGYAFGPTLLYAKGGAAFLNLQDKVTYFGGDNFSNNATVWGWTAGAGLEYLINPAWSFKLEYRYFDFESNTIPTPASIGGGGVKGTAEANAVTVGFNYHVGQSYVPLK